MLDPAFVAESVIPSILYLRLDSRYGYRIRMMDPSYLDSSWSLMDCKIHGSEVTHWLSGTPSSKSLTMTAEKLYAGASALLRRTRKRDLLLEEQCFISRIRLHVLLESFILHERVIRPEE